MARAPADQFYFADFTRDTRSLSIAARGAWMDCLCEMWFSVTRGRISKPLISYSRYWGTSIDQAKALVDEILELKVADGGIEPNGNITLINRRMFNEWQEEEANRIRQFRHRAKQKAGNNAESNANVTFLSSSSDFSNTQKTPEPDFDYPLRELYEAFPEIQITPGQAGLIVADVRTEDREAWLSTLKLYKANHNPMTRAYLPEKVGTLLKVFQAEKRSLEKSNGSSQGHRGSSGKQSPGATIINRPYRKNNA